jgi:2-C-methyl-D-erythritol 4-phosphate cytidylyltransferase
MKNIAVLLCSGSGKRFNSSKPKQFSKLAGKMIIEYTIDRFNKNKNIDEIIIVTQNEYIDFIWEIAKKNNFSKIKLVINGGKERFHSTLSAITALNDYDDLCNILIHDGVRPLVTDRIINDCLSALNDYDAVDVVIESTDTLVEVDDDLCITKIPNRSHLRRGQTPQAFKLHCIKKAYQAALETNNEIFTCDCGVVRSLLPNVTIKAINGDIQNIKITNPIDQYIAEKLLQSSQNITKTNYSKHNTLNNKVLVIFGGNSGIGLSIQKLARKLNITVEVASRTFNNVDITNIKSIEDYLCSVIEKYKKIDFVINTAGLLIRKPIDFLSHQEILDLININYTGAVNVSIASKKYLSITNGMLLHFTSSSYTRGRANYAIYSSSNAAIVNLTQALSEEWSNTIRVNCINPERTLTPMRITNFGIEPAETLLSPEVVARKCLDVLDSQSTGLIIDIKK